MINNYVKSLRFGLPLIKSYSVHGPEIASPYYRRYYERDYYTIFIWAYQQYISKAILTSSCIWIQGGPLRKHLHTWRTIRLKVIIPSQKSWNAILVGQARYWHADVWISIIFKPINSYLNIPWRNGAYKYIIRLSLFYLEPIAIRTNKIVSISFRKNVPLKKYIFILMSFQWLDYYFINTQCWINCIFRRAPINSANLKLNSCVKMLSKL